MHTSHVCTLCFIDFLVLSAVAACSFTLKNCSWYLLLMLSVFILLYLGAGIFLLFDLVNLFCYLLM